MSLLQSRHKAGIFQKILQFYPIKFIKRLNQGSRKKKKQMIEGGI